MLKYCQYRNGCDEDGPAVPVCREPAVGESWQPDAIRPITSELECRAILPDVPGCPRYRDRTCRSPKGMVCDHNLSGTAGNFARLKICLEAIFLCPS